MKRRRSTLGFFTPSFPIGPRFLTNKNSYRSNRSLVPRISTVSVSSIESCLLRPFSKNLSVSFSFSSLQLTSFPSLCPKCFLLPAVSYLLSLFSLSLQQVSFQLVNSKIRLSLKIPSPSPLTLKDPSLPPLESNHPSKIVNIAISE